MPEHAVRFCLKQDVNSELLIINVVHPILLLLWLQTSPFWLVVGSTDALSSYFFGCA